MGTTTTQLITQVTNYPDYLIIGAIVILLAVYGFIRGTKALSELALALPIATFVYTVIPYNINWGEPVVFAILAVASTIVVSRYTSGLDDDKEIPKVVLSALGATGLLLVISAGMVDFTPLYTFGAPIADILANPIYKFYVLVASLVAIALSRKV